MDHIINFLLVLGVIVFAAVVLALPLTIAVLYGSGVEGPQPVGTYARINKVRNIIIFAGYGFYIAVAVWFGTAP